MKIKGFLEAFFETGTEGVIWCLYISKDMDWEAPRAYENLHVVKSGETLTIWDIDKKVLFNGVVDLDFSVKTAGNYYVNGVQRGVNSEDWLNWFEYECEAEIETKE